MTTKAAAPYQPGPSIPTLEIGARQCLDVAMHILSFLLCGATTAALLLCSSCGDGPGSICGAERPCIPAGTWIVSYAMTASGQSFTENTIRIDTNGAVLVGEEVPDDTCGTSPIPGNLTTAALLSRDGCTVVAAIFKDWCDSGEANCEERNIALDFCHNGSTTVAAGSLEACVCGLTGGASCSTDAEFVTVGATAVRTAQ
jgi:hypothetical protein